MEVKSTDVIETLASDHLPVMSEITLVRGNKP